MTLHEALRRLWWRLRRRSLLPSALRYAPRDSRWLRVVSDGEGIRVQGSDRFDGRFADFAPGNEPDVRIERSRDQPTGTVTGISISLGSARRL